MVQKKKIHHGVHGEEVFSKGIKWFTQSSQNAYAKVHAKFAKCIRKDRK
jgi:hypothetical protein